jgi:hypothetical protein
MTPEVCLRARLLLLMSVLATCLSHTIYEYKLVKNGAGRDNCRLLLGVLQRQAFKKKLVLGVLKQRLLESRGTRHLTAAVIES